jgi:hypothetical protein
MSRRRREARRQDRPAVRVEVSGEVAPVAVEAVREAVMATPTVGTFYVALDPGTPPPVVVLPNLETMTVAQLRQLALESGVSLRGAKTKALIIEALRA